MRFYSKHTSLCCAKWITLSAEGILHDSFLENNFTSMISLMKCGKNNPDFVQPLVAFRYSNICYFREWIVVGLDHGSYAPFKILRDLHISFISSELNLTIFQRSFHRTHLFLILLITFIFIAPWCRFFVLLWSLCSFFRRRLLLFATPKIFITTAAFIFLWTLWRFRLEVQEKYKYMGVIQPQDPSAFVM